MGTRAATFGSNGNLFIGTAKNESPGVGGLIVAGRTELRGILTDASNVNGTTNQLFTATATGTKWVTLTNPYGGGIGIQSIIDSIYNNVSVDTWTKTGNYIYPTTITDSVGIGTTSPTARLQVNGTFKLFNGTSATNFEYGFSPLNMYPSAGSPGATVNFKDAGGTTNAAISAISGSATIDLNGTYRVHDGTAMQPAMKKTTAGAGLLLGNAAWNRIATTNQVVIGSETIESTASLQLVGTNKAFYPNSMTTTQRDAVTWQAGAVIYNTTTNKHQGYNGTTWNDFY